jgi:hypothetical protein
MLNFKVVCINDSDKPEDIPSSKWVKKDQIYTVIEVSKMRMQGNKLGFKLAEINLDSCFPYQYFASSRFMPLLRIKDMSIEETLERLLEEVKKEELQNEKIQQA